MKTTLSLAAALLLAGPHITLQAAEMTMAGLGRVDLVKQDLSTPGHEVVQARVDFGPGVTAPAHSHPGDEVAYVLVGTIEYRLAGRAPVILQTGQSLFIPAGTVHSARNVSTGEAKELASYFVEKGKPLVVLQGQSAATVMHEH